MVSNSAVPRSPPIESVLLAIADVDGSFSGRCVVTYPDGEPRFDGAFRHGEWHGAKPATPRSPPKCASLFAQASNSLGFQLSFFVGAFGNQSPL